MTFSPPGTRGGERGGSVSQAEIMWPAETQAAAAERSLLAIHGGLRRLFCITVSAGRHIWSDRDQIFSGTLFMRPSRATHPSCGFRLQRPDYDWRLEKKKNTCNMTFRIPRRSPLLFLVTKVHHYGMNSLFALWLGTWKTDVSCIAFCRTSQIWVSHLGFSTKVLASNFAHGSTDRSLTQQSSGLAFNTPFMRQNLLKKKQKQKKTYTEGLILFIK